MQMTFKRIEQCWHNDLVINKCKTWVNRSDFCPITDGKNDLFTVYQISLSLKAQQYKICLPNLQCTYEDTWAQIIIVVCFLHKKTLYKSKGSVQWKEWHRVNQESVHWQKRHSFPI